MNQPNISLINHEGDCLWAIRSDDNIVVYDQWEDLVDIMTIPQFCEWLDGDIGLTDSNGKTWYWNKEPQDSKPSMLKLVNFLK